MFNQLNEIALGIYNNVIWALHTGGQRKAVEIVEKQRDREALQMLDKKQKAYDDRQKIYEKVQTIIARGQMLKNTPIQMKIEVIDLKQELARVFYCLATNLVKLREYDKSKDLYNAVVFSYMYTFENWRDGQELHRGQFYDMRATFSTIERCIRFIKADHPGLFNAKLIKKAAGDDFQATDSFGNVVIGL